jgi:hypothetical protein
MLSHIWGKAISLIRGRGAAVDPVAMVHAWRQRLATQVGGQAHEWEWPETLDTSYETDKPGFDGYGAVQVWAAYAESPGQMRPVAHDDNWGEDTVFVRVSEAPARFPHLIGPELWLPVGFSDVFEAEEPTGRSCPKIGSVFGLWDELRELNQRTWQSDDETIRQWRKEDYEPELLDSTARWGFSILFCLVEYAIKNRLPVRMDY